MYNTLPFNPNALERQFLNVGYDRPPVVPPIDAPPELAAYVPTVAGGAALVIQTNAQRNPLRYFQYNQLSVNGYANEDFAVLIATIFDLAQLNLVTRKSPNPSAAFDDAVPKVIEMFAALNLQHFPALQGYLDPQAINMAHALIGTYNQIGGEIRQMKAQGRVQQGGYQQTPHYGQQYGQPYQQPYQQQANGPSYLGGQQTGQRYGQPQNQGNVWNNGSSYSGGPQYQPQSGQTPFNRYQNAGAPQTNTAPPPSAGRFDQNPLRQPFTPRQETTMNQVPAPQQASNYTPQPAAPVEEYVAPVAPPEPLTIAWSSGEVEWKASAEYPYFPAYNPYKHDLYLVIREDGATIPELRERNPVDYNQHSVKTIFGTPPKGDNAAHRAAVLARIAEGVRKLNANSGVSAVATAAPADASEVTEDAPAPELSVVVNRDWVSHVSESDAWLIGAIERLRGDAGGVPDVYRTLAYIAEPLVGTTDETSMVASFGAAPTFFALREKLVAATNSISPALAGCVNARATALVNRLLRQNLGSPLVITSFVEDYPELEAVIESQHGQTVLSAFLRHQAAHIQGTFDTMGEVATDILTAGLVDPGEYGDGPVPKITYVMSKISLTHLNCRASELETNLVEGLSSAITPKLMPLLHSLLEGLFSTTESETWFERHLLRTTDGRVLEASRGYLVQNDVYLLTLIE